MDMLHQANVQMVCLILAESLCERIYARIVDITSIAFRVNVDSCICCESEKAI